MREHLNCNGCLKDYFIEWNECEDPSWKYEDSYEVPDFCPFCGDIQIEIDEE